LRPWLAATLLASVSISAAASDPIPHHRLELELDPQARTLSVHDELRLPPGRRAWLSPGGGLLLEWLELDGVGLRPKSGKDSFRLTGAETGRLLKLRYRMRLPADSEIAGSGEAGLYLPPAHWLPDTGAGPVTFSLGIAIPENYRALATGNLRTEQLGQGRYRALFAMEQPADPPSLFAGRWQVTERAIGGTRLRAYFYPEQADLAASYLDASAAFLQRYQSQIGDYPFTGFAVVAATLPVGFGFQGLTYVSREILALPFMRGRSLAHEVLHSWWGNGVYVDYAQGNWAEGLTTYLADYALAVEAGEASAREMRLDWLRDLAALPASRDEPLIRFTSKDHDAAQAIGYGKSALLFHQLRARLGEAAFVAGLRRFWAERQFQEADWEALRQAFEGVADGSLESFFQQWLVRTGLPKLSLEDVVGSAADGLWRVSFTLSQESPAYWLSVPIRLDTVAGTEWHRPILSAASQRFEVALAARPLTLAVDPDFELPRRLDSAERPPILRDVTLHPATRVMIAAEGAGAREAAALAARIMDVPVATLAPRDTLAAGTPVLLVGVGSEVDTLAAELGLHQIETFAPPAADAVVWTARRASGAAALVIRARNGETLARLQRALPHYGRQSYLALIDDRVALQGVWPAGEGSLIYRFPR
jgi:hypothetical protein